MITHISKHWKVHCPWLGFFSVQRWRHHLHHDRNFRSFSSAVMDGDPCLSTNPSFSSRQVMIWCLFWSVSSHSSRLAIEHSWLAGWWSPDRAASQWRSQWPYKGRLLFHWLVCQGFCCFYSLFYEFDIKFITMALKQTDKLRLNIEEQLERLVKQLEDLESYRYVKL